MGLEVKFRALTLKKPKHVELVEHSGLPKLGPREVLVKMKSVSLCETDVKIYKGHVKTKKLPIIMGHEGVGEVVEVGDKVTGLNPGDRVLVDPNVYDETCPLCRLGEVHLCINGGLMGRDFDGLFTEYTAVRDLNLYKLPNTIRDKVAPLIQPLSTVVHAHNLVNIKPGDTVLVIGTGVTGLMHIQISKKRGGQVIAVGRNPYKLEIAKRVGADYTVLLSGESINEVYKLTEGDGADLVIEAVGSPETLGLGFRLLKPRGTLLQFGISGDAFSYDMYSAYYREVRIQASRSSKPSDFIRSIELVRKGIIDLEPIVSMEAHFEDFLDVLEYVLENKSKILRPIIKF